MPILHYFCTNVSIKHIKYSSFFIYYQFSYTINCFSLCLIRFIYFVVVNLYSITAESQNSDSNVTCVQKRFENDFSTHFNHAINEVHMQLIFYKLITKNIAFL